MSLPVNITRSLRKGLREYSTLKNFGSRSSQVYSIINNIRNSSTYKAAVLKEPNKVISIEGVEPVPLQKNQVRIATHACALNASDLLMCQGLSKIQPQLPFIPGYEVAGEVLEINIDKEADKKNNKKKNDKQKDDDDDDDDDIIPLSIGDRVIGLSRERLGGFSEQCIVDYKDVWRIPASLDYKTAVGLADTYALALLGLFRRAQIRNSDIVLVTAGPGGLGVAAVDIAANVYKSKVIAVCNSEACAEQLRGKGAWSAITYSDKKLQNKVKEISGTHGADIVFETIGGEMFESAIHSVAPEGKVIIGGFASHRVPDVPMSELLVLPSFSLIGVSLRNYREFAYKIYRQIVNDTIELYSRGLVTPLISKTFTLEEVNDALLHIKETDSVGKIVLIINNKK